MIKNSLDNKRCKCLSTIPPAVSSPRHQDHCRALGVQALISRSPEEGTSSRVFTTSGKLTWVSLCHWKQRGLNKTCKPATGPPSFVGSLSFLSSMTRKIRERDHQKPLVPREFSLLQERETPLTGKSHPWTEAIIPLGLILFPSRVESVDKGTFS